MPVPFSSKDHNKINLVNIADTSAIINNTITSNHIADNSIINNNFADGSITSDKLSTALQNIFVDFGNRLTALEIPPKTGFYGDFLVINETQTGSNPRHIHAYLAYNNVALTNSVQINGGQGHLFNIAQEDRLPLQNSSLQLKITAQSGTQALDLGAYDGFTITNFTTNPLNEENTMSMIVNENQIDDGSCSATLLITYVPPGWSGNITFVYQAGGGTTQFITIKTEAGFIATNYTYNSGSNVFSVSLASPSSYLYIQLVGAHNWDITNNSFSQAVGSPTYVREDGRLWERYTIPSEFIGQNLTYNFSTYDND